MTSKRIHLMQTAENYENQAQEQRKTNYLSKRLYSNVEDKFQNGKSSRTLWFLVIFVFLVYYQHFNFLYNSEKIICENNFRIR